MQAAFAHPMLVHPRVRGFARRDATNLERIAFRTGRRRR
jgi:hypothetical protein